MVKKSIVNTGVREDRVAYIISPKVSTLPINVAGTTILGNCDGVSTPIGVIEESKGFCPSTNYRVFPMWYKLRLRDSLSSLYLSYLSECLPLYGLTF